MDQNPTQQQQQHQNNRRTPTAAGETAAPRQNQTHPPPQPCPRCNSTNTKFCYYNNYSLSQPRYFCKGCRRYWTHGGTLRNVPVGGGCRKSKRPKLSSTAASSSPPIPPPQDTTVAANHPGVSTLGVAPAINSPSPFYGSASGGGGGSGGGFLSSLAAIHSGAQPLGFGPNLGLFHGLGLPGFENQPPPAPPPQHNPELSFQQLLQRRPDNSMYQGTDVGVVPTSDTGASTSANWNLSNDDNNRHQSHWTDFPAASGLDDP